MLSLIAIEHSKLYDFFWLSPNIKVTQGSHLPQKYRLPKYIASSIVLAFDLSKGNDINCLFLYDVDPLKGYLWSILWKGQINEVLIKDEKRSRVLFGDRMSVYQLVPVVTVPNLEEGWSEDAYVMLVDGIVEDEFIVDQLFDELRSFGFPVVLIDRDFIRLHEVEKLAFYVCAKHLSLRVSAEPLVVKLSCLPSRYYRAHLIPGIKEI